MPYRLLSTGLPRVRIEDPLNPMTEGVAFAAGNLLQLPAQLREIEADNAQKQAEINFRKQEIALRQQNYESEASHRAAMEQQAAAALANTKQHQADLLSLQKRQDAIANAAKYGIEDPEQGLTNKDYVPGTYETVDDSDENGPTTSSNVIDPGKFGKVDLLHQRYIENETAPARVRADAAANILQERLRHSDELNAKELEFRKRENDLKLNQQKVSEYNKGIDKQNHDAQLNYKSKHTEWSKDPRRFDPNSPDFLKWQSEQPKPPEMIPRINSIEDIDQQKKPTVAPEANTMDAIASKIVADRLAAQKTKGK